MKTWLLATFLTPEHIGTTPTSMLWALPLIISISVVYKATKVYRIKKSFIKESMVLAGSIVVFLAVAAIILCVVAWFFNEKMGLLVK